MDVELFDFLGAVGLIAFVLAVAALSVLLRDGPIEAQVAFDLNFLYLAVVWACIKGKRWAFQLHAALLVLAIAFISLSCIVLVSKFKTSPIGTVVTAFATILALYKGLLQLRGALPSLPRASQS
jgi:hypothetical protein